jgi:feruloyl esterase
LQPSFDLTSIYHFMPTPPKQSFAFVLIAIGLIAETAATPWCENLQGMTLPKAHIESVNSVARGDALVMWSGALPSPSPHAFCRVRGTATPVKGSRIGFEVWLPEPPQWNGKFMQAGNGGTAGGIPLSSLMDGVGRGYATAATDGGYVWPNGLDYGWAKGHPERVVDFGWRAVQQTTLAAKKIVARGYGNAPRKSYFVGCSDGGRDAMMAAQRFATEWDGVVSGAPAQDWLGLMIGGALMQREMTSPAVGLSTAQLPALQAAVLASCGKGKGYVESPEDCQFDPKILQCTGQQLVTCLTESQVTAVRKVYAGLTDASGQRVHGLSMGAEAESGNWDFWLLRASTNPIGGEPAKPVDSPPTSINESFFRYLVRGGDEKFILADMRDSDVNAARKRYSQTLDAINPDLRALKAKGAKLLQYHGWADAAIPPGISLSYFNRVQQGMGDTASFYRLFMVPGMNHCSGGAGPWSVDWLAALERWVEAGEAPQELTAKHPKSNATQTLKSYAKP